MRLRGIEPVLAPGSRGRRGGRQRGRGRDLVRAGPEPTRVQPANPRTQVPAGGGARGLCRGGGAGSRPAPRWRARAAASGCGAAQVGKDPVDPRGHRDEGDDTQLLAAPHSAQGHVEKRQYVGVSTTSGRRARHPVGAIAALCREKRQRNGNCLRVVAAWILAEPCCGLPGAVGSYPVISSRLAVPASGRTRDTKPPAARAVGA